ncbi:hypothetical protein DFH29DRAFT_626878 [Suillus ampliporus]|nr:hypothetical protein DFH29DRAFT_626878 [Suillus ampliporus]
MARGSDVHFPSESDEQSIKQTSEGRRQFASVAATELGKICFRDNNSRPQFQATALVGHRALIRVFYTRFFAIFFEIQPCFGFLPGDQRHDIRLNFDAALQRWRSNLAAHPFASPRKPMVCSALSRSFNMMHELWLGIPLFTDAAACVVHGYPATHYWPLKCCDAWCTIGRLFIVILMFLLSTQKAFSLNNNTNNVYDTGHHDMESQTYGFM